jgi:serine/threonine protein kinase
MLPGPLPQGPAPATPPPPGADGASLGDDLAIGSVVGEYRIERWLGAGGMGVVYGARHPLIGKRAAVKVLGARFSADPQAVARFVQEAQAVNQIGHPNIVDIFAFGTLPDGRAYFVMEWLVGESLQDRLERGPLPLREVLSILSAIARALEAVHAAGVVHRDLKPDNVFLVADDDGLRIKLLDFGIAKLSADAPTVSRTATGMIMGTPLFMSPEQARGEMIDARTDIYSLGIMAYHMVCGETPFGREPSAIEVLSAHISKPPPLPSARQPGTPPSLEALIVAMLAKQPSARPALVDVRRRLVAITAEVMAEVTAAEAAAALPAATGVLPLAAPSEPSPPSPGGSDAFPASAVSLPGVPAMRTSRRSRVVAVAALALVSLGVGAYLATTTSAPDEPAPAPVAAAAPRTASRPDIPQAGARTTSAAASRAPARTAIAAPPAPEPTTGVATFSIDPPGATVVISGHVVTLEHGQAQVVLPAGEHQLVVTASGRKSIRQPLVIHADQTTDLTLRLDRRGRCAHGIVPDR